MDSSMAVSYTHLDVYKRQVTGKWKIKLNELKSVHINFTNKRIENSLPVTLNVL